MAIARNSKGRISTLKTQFVEEFDMKALRVVNQILRIKMLWEREEEYLAFTKGLCGEDFQRFNIQRSKLVSAPFPIYLKLLAEQSPGTKAERANLAWVLYSFIVGSLMFAMVRTRSDISQAVGTMSQFMMNSSSKNWNAEKWLVNYLRGTTNFSFY